MEKAIIGKKVGMTQIFDADGKVIPVTLIEAGPCTVVQKKTEEKDGYSAVQLGYGDVAEKKLTKPELGHLKKAGDVRKKTLKEFRLANCDALNVGDEVKARRVRRGRPRGRDRHQQGPRLPGRHQAPRRPPPEGVPRHRPCAPPRRLHGPRHRSLPHLQGQDRSRPDGQRGRSPSSTWTW